MFRNALSLVLITCLASPTVAAVLSTVDGTFKVPQADGYDVSFGATTTYGGQPSNGFTLLDLQPGFQAVVTSDSSPAVEAMIDLLTDGNSSYVRIWSSIIADGIQYDEAEISPMGVDFAAYSISGFAVDLYNVTRAATYDEFDVVVSIVGTSVIPEPASLLIVVAALVGCLFSRFRF